VRKEWRGAIASGADPGVIYGACRNPRSRLRMGKGEVRGKRGRSPFPLSRGSPHCHALASQPRVEILGSSGALAQPCLARRHTRRPPCAFEQSGFCGAMDGDLLDNLPILDAGDESHRCRWHTRSFGSLSLRSAREPPASATRNFWTVVLDSPVTATWPTSAESRSLGSATIRSC